MAGKLFPPPCASLPIQTSQWYFHSLMTRTQWHASLPNQPPGRVVYPRGHRIVAYLVTSSIPVPLKTRLCLRAAMHVIFSKSVGELKRPPVVGVGQRCTLNLWCGS
ncbi:hypothetical protein TNCV_164321 [Trichonephila clavipes]|nr:hypothetical protein TNCV_164321 [Trichonephila clavipes]